MFPDPRVDHFAMSSSIIGQKPDFQGKQLK
jgi:hypothetical protein